MKGPLHPRMYDTATWPDSWWRASAPAWQGPAPLDGDLDTDVAVIGGGYAGLSTATGLAKAGIGAVVLDAAEIGWGASGRNGGMVGYGGYKASVRTMRRRYGEDECARFQAALRGGIDWVREFCEAEGMPVQGVAEDIYAHSPQAYVALTKGHKSDTEQTLIPPSDSGDMAKHGGIRIAPSFGIHPLRLVRTLADRAVDAGVRVCPQSEVTAWHREGGRHRLVTPKGTVTADRVVIATNGFAPDGLHPDVDGRAVPVISNIGVTRVLTEEEQDRHPWLGDDPVADTRNLLVYLRLLPEGRLLLGARGDLTGAPKSSAAMRNQLTWRIAECFPGWAGIPLDYFWNGPICATASYTPSVGALPNDPTVFTCFGWHGSGVNAANLAGRLLAEVIAGALEDTIPAPMRGLPRRLPLPGLRPLYVGMALVQQRIQDFLS
ncbi:MAG: FAD-binding oxidoreductase [Pseudomonadota bacterium]